MTYIPSLMDADRTGELAKQISKLVLCGVAAIVALVFTFRRNGNSPANHPSTQSGTSSDGFPIPEECDFAAVADEIRGMLKMAENEAKTLGTKAYFKYEFLAAVVPFLESPCRETAISLLNVAPHLGQYFHAYGPDGEFTAYKKILGE
jgi:hypothetical protein